MATDPGSDSSGPHEPEAVLPSLSEAEHRFERWRKATGLFLGPLALALVWMLPIPSVSPEAHRLAAVMSLVVVWWMTEPVPLAVTALAGSALTVVLGIASAQEAFAPFASPTIFLFIGAFMLGRAAGDHGLDRRVAYGLLSFQSVRGSVLRIGVAMGALTLAISAWMSNTATTAMMLPVASGVLHAVATSGQRLPRGGPAAFLLAIAYAASIGGIMTPVGTPPNLITLGLLEKIAGVKVNFLIWMLVAVPISLVMGVALFVVTGRKLVVRGTSSQALGAFVPGGAETRWTPGQRNVAIAFSCAVAGWIAPGVAGLAWPEARATAWLTSHLEESIIAVLAASLLFVLPVNLARRQFTITWESASQIDWGTILLFGGGLALGRLMFTTGLAAHMGQGLVDVSGADSLWAITALGLVVAVVLTEVASNTAATNMLVPVILSVAHASGVAPVPPAMGVCLGASMAFMLPVSTPPNAIVYGTGLVPVLTMVKYGLLMDAIAIAIIFLGLRILCPLLGLA